MNDRRHAALIHASNCITLSSDLVDIADILIVTYGTPWKSRRRRWIKKGEELRL